MRDSHRLKEKYELSLDDRQIATFTVVSLVVLGGVFMLGVVVGKRLAGTEVAAAANTKDVLELADERTAAIESSRAKEADAATSLTFQDELTKKAPAVALARPAKALDERTGQEKAPEKPLERPPEKLAERPPEKAEAPSASSASAPGPVAAAAARAAEHTELPESPKPEATATRTTDGGGLKEAFVKVQKSAPSAAPGGAWTVQLAAYQERAEADRFAAGLRDKGYAPYIVEVAIPGKGNWFRVRMGRFPTKDAAARYMEDFKRETSINALVTQAN